MIRADLLATEGQGGSLGDIGEASAQAEAAELDAPVLVQ